MENESSLTSHNAHHWSSALVDCSSKTRKSCIADPGMELTTFRKHSHTTSRYHDNVGGRYSHQTHPVLSTHQLSAHQLSPQCPHTPPHLPLRQAVNLGQVCRVPVYQLLQTQKARKHKKGSGCRADSTRNYCSEHMMSVGVTGGLGDLGIGGGPSQPSQQEQQQPSFQDPFGAPAPSPATSAPAQPSLPVLLSADKAKGLTLRGQLARMDGRIGMPSTRSTQTQMYWHCWLSIMYKQLTSMYSTLTSLVSKTQVHLLCRYKSCCNALKCLQNLRQAHNLLCCHPGPTALLYPVRHLWQCPKRIYLTPYCWLTVWLACSVQAAVPQRHPRPTGKLHDPVQQELLWSGAQHTECASASVGAWKHSDGSAAIGAEPHASVTNCSLCSPAGTALTCQTVLCEVCMIYAFWNTQSCSLGMYTFACLECST